MRAVRMRLGVVMGMCMLGASWAHALPVCAPTQRVVTQNYPGAPAIPTGNNLLLPAGKSVEADGQKFILKGRVLDKNCAPISEASVELWQNNPYGRWLLATGQDLATPDARFAGAGRTYTNHNGEFTFISAFPAPLGKRAPFVNVKVSGWKLPDFSTALFFSGDARNANDEVYNKILLKTRRDVTIQVHQDAQGELIGSVDLVLPTKAQFIGY